MRRVFVSYSRNNLEAVTQLIKHMKDVGLEMWYDQALTGGQRWWDNILSNIRECDIFVFALSPESWDSEACKSELAYVVQLGKPILPVLVSEGININLLSPPLSDIQITDYRRRDMDAAFAVLKSINLAPAAPNLPEPLPKSPPVPISYLSTLKDRIDSTEPLSSQDQITLFFELEQELQDGHSPTETRDLLLRLKRRDDLLAKIASKIDAALKGMEGMDLVPREPRGPSNEQKEDSVRPVPAKPRPCPRCRTQVEPGLSFCGKCGAKVEMTSTVADPPDDVPHVEGSKSRRYICAQVDSARLIADVRRWLESENFTTQQVSTDDHGVLLQIKKRGKWRDYFGMATSLNIGFHQSGDALTVQIGTGNWVDKAAAGTVGMLVLWPLAFTAGYGIWEQTKIPDKVFDFIGARLTYK
jgi:hypothetical protein